jgi:hypothetical protein
VGEVLVAQVSEQGAHEQFLVPTLQVHAQERVKRLHADLGRFVGLGVGQDQVA